MERNKRSPICKNLIPGLTERGKIKIGCKGQSRKKSDGSGTYQLPQKLDHFIVTTLERNHDGNFVKDETIHKIIGDKPKEIPVILMFDDIALNFQCRYACYNGKTLFCSGDGEFADQLTEQKTRKEVSCPCYRHEPTYTGKDKCKINGTLSVMIQGHEEWTRICSAKPEPQQYGFPDCFRYLQALLFGSPFPLNPNTSIIKIQIVHFNSGYFTST